jgi:hypothetical protein
MSNKDLTKALMYEGVKTLVETDEKFIHLTQPKLFTLVSLAFQYFLYLSTKEAGYYILRVEDSQLLEKIARKSKDDITRKFITKLTLPRKLKYGQSTFMLDFFHLGSWQLTKDLPVEKIKGALVIKNSDPKPFGHFLESDEEGAEAIALPQNYFLTSLQEVVPKIITIAFDESFEGFKKIEFPFIKCDERERLAKGVKISHDIDTTLLE